MSLLDRKRDNAGSTLPAMSRHDEDRYSWAQEQVALLQAGRVGEIDVRDLVEVLNDVSGSEYDKLESALTIVLLHLLKWDHQPARQTRSWVNSILEHRRRAEKQIRKNPGLKGRLSEAIEDGYEYARTRCGTETSIELELLPRSCPYDWNEIMTREITWPVAERSGR